MASINKIGQEIIPLVRNSRVDRSFDSHYSRTVTDFFAGSAERPYMNEIRYTAGDKLTGLYVERQLKNGNKFVMFNVDGQIFKAIRNRFCEIISAKANYEMPLDNPELAFKYAQATLAERNKLISGSR